jgi:hypothetical protein
MAFWLLIGILGALGYIKEGAVIEILGNDFDTFHIDFYDKIRVISFYSFSFNQPQPFNTMYFKLAKQLKNSTLPIVFGKIDRNHAKNKELLTKFSPNTSPYVIYYLSNSTTPHIYKSSTSASLFIENIKKYIHKINYFTEVEELKDTILVEYPLDGLVLGVFNETNAKAKEEFIKFSIENAHIYKFGMIEYSDELKEETGIPGTGIVACRGPGLISFGDDYYRYNTDLESLNLAEWLRTNFHPHITYQTKDREPFLYTNNPLVTLVMNLSRVDVQRRFVDRIIYHSQQYFDKGWDEQKYILAIADREEYLDELLEDGVENEPFVYVVKHKDNKYVIDENVYYGDGGFSHEGLKKIFYDFPIGVLKPHIKSEKNAKDEENSIIVATGRNFEEKVIKSNKDQLVYVYGTPTHLGLLETYAKQKHIEIVKINKNLNKLPNQYRANGEESLFLSRQNKKWEAILYTYNFDIKEIRQFVNSYRQTEDL